MGYFFLISIGLIIGVTIAFLISEISPQWGFTAGAAILFILLFVGGELLSFIKKVPAIERPWRYYNHNDEDEDADGDNSSRPG
jgi:hypothetical protein